MAPTDSPTRVPTLWVDPWARGKIEKYGDVCRAEISGFGYLSKLSRTDILLSGPDDVFITDQVVTGGSADVISNTLAAALSRATLEGRGSELRLQWHSHVYGSAYHSGIDMDTIDGYAKQGMQWMVSMVVNKFGDLTARLDQFVPFRLGMPMVVKPYIRDDQIEAACRGDIERHVKQRIIIPGKKPSEDRELLIGPFDPIPPTARSY